MRIVQVIPDFKLGGIQKAGCVLADSMSRMGHEVAVMGVGKGPRFQENPEGTLSYISLADKTPETAVEQIIQLQPDIVHIHAHGYNEPLVELLHEHSTSKKPVVVSTPVFGRPPLHKTTLEKTYICCVGVYTFYRLCHWLNITGEQAIKQGMVFAPLTPFQPSQSGAAATDEATEIEARRIALGLPENAFVVGRIGRCHVDKWHPCHEEFVTRLLESSSDTCWLSVGFPAERGRDRLKERWGGRFLDFPETADYEFLIRVFSCMDIQTFFSPSGECFASTICEAVCTGVPTIAICNPLKDNGQAEQIVEGVNGYLVRSWENALNILLSLHNQTDRLSQLKCTAQHYGLHRWHADRVSSDVLTQYEAYVQSRPANSVYSETILDEYKTFSHSYKPRIIAIMATGVVRTLIWSILLNAVNSWQMFKLGRFFKNLKK